MGFQFDFEILVQTYLLLHSVSFHADQGRDSISSHSAVGERKRNAAEQDEINGFKIIACGPRK